MGGGGTESSAIGGGGPGTCGVLQRHGIWIGGPGTAVCGVAGPAHTIGVADRIGMWEKMTIGVSEPTAARSPPCGPFRRLIKDYHMVVEAHEQAVAESGPESRVQAIDMGRRGLHNEGAELLRTRLAGRVALDFDTARQLFTLVCALHQRI